MELSEVTDSRRARGSARARPPWWLWVAAAAFALYFALLVVSDIERPDTTGLLVEFDARGAVAAAVAPGSPADAAGIRQHDRIVSYCGRAVPTRLDWLATDMNLVPGTMASLRIDRDGRTVTASLPLQGRYVRFPPRLDTIALGIALAGQAFTLLLAGLVIFKRAGDRLARLGAWLLASGGVFTIVLPFGFAARWHALPWPLPLLFWLPFVTAAAPGVLFFVFACSFPRPAFRVRWTVVACCTPAIVPLAWHVHFGVATVMRSAAEPVAADWSVVVVGANVVYLAAGLGVLAWQLRHTTQASDRRRLRVLLAGCAVACGACLMVALRFWLRPTPELTHSLFSSPVTLVGVPLMLALPLSIAYTILRQRLFDVSVIVRHGVRYALARRLLLSLAPMLVLAVSVDVLRHGREPLFELLETRGWRYAVTAAALVAVLVNRDRWLTALDRRFFRGRYHAERILRDVAARLRDGRDPLESIRTVVEHADRALAPRGIAALTWEHGDAAYRVAVSVPEALHVVAFEPAGRLVALARVLERPIDLSPDADAWIAEHLPADEAARVFESGLELLVPVIVEDDRHVLLVLGPRRSEEPYSADDRALLEAVAGNLALVLERATPPPVDVWLSECPVCGGCHDTGVARCPDDRALLVPTDLPPLLGRRYRLERRLGAGGMGTVYAAQDTSLGRGVAVKVLADHLVDSRDAARRFRQEAQTAAAFAHPHVVTIHDFGVTEAQRAYLVMERLEGTTLRAALSGGALHVARVLVVACDVCDVLGAAHARGLVHRDLKPENVFLARVGQAETTKVLDFGIAKALHGDGTDTSTTRTGHGVILGTLPYMAPEQLAGGTVQPSWDLWALAVTTHEMLTGRHPREGRGRGLSSSLASFFEAVLAEDPHARPATAAAFREALVAALASPGVGRDS